MVIWFAPSLIIPHFAGKRNGENRDFRGTLCTKGAADESCGPMLARLEPALALLDRLVNGDYPAVSLGLYEQDGNDENGSEPVRWLPVKLENGEIADMAVDYIAPEGYLASMDIFVTSKKWLIEFLCGYGNNIVDKSDKHMNIINQLYEHCY